VLVDNDYACHSGFIQLTTGHRPLTTDHDHCLLTRSLGGLYDFQVEVNKEQHCAAI